MPKLTINDTEYNTEDFNEKFQFALGENRVISSIIADSEETFKQSTAIMIDGEYYYFKLEYKYDPSEGYSHTRIIFDGCDNAWETTTNTELPGDW